MTRAPSAHPEPGRAVTAAADRDLDAVLAGEPHAGDDVGGVPAARDRRRVLVDHAVVDGPRLVVARISRQDQLTAQAAASSWKDKVASRFDVVVMWPLGASREARSFVLSSDRTTDRAILSTW